MTSPLRDLRARRFWRTFLTYSLACAGAIATLAQGIDVFAPGAITDGDFPVVQGAVVGSLLFGINRAWPRAVIQFYTVGNTAIQIVEGDLFDQSTNLVIGMTTTFDTEGPHIISDSSVQAQFLARVYSGDLAALDSALSEALREVDPVGQRAKPGKQIVYPIGTVASIRLQRRHFYCVALAEMDNFNSAHATVAGLWNSLDSLWDVVRRTSNGDPVAIPVLGGGQSKLSQVLPARDAIRLIALSFTLASRAARVCQRLDIVVRKQDVQNLDILELRTFLHSLRAS